MAKQYPTAETLREVLDYDAETGIFRWKKSLSAKIKIGSLAGTKHPRGWQISSKILGGAFLAHRLAWMYVTGKNPGEDMVIDHRDRNPMNNAFSNLRLCTQQQNTWNQSLKKQNKTGVKGVSLLPSGKFHARLRTGDGIKLLGNFDDLESATLAIDAARVKYHGEFAAFG